MSEISLSKEKFLRSSKKLNSILKATHNVDLKLNQSQELLSTVLGFKNFHAVDEIFKSSNPAKTIPSSIPIINKVDLDFLQTQSSATLSSLICSFLLGDSSPDTNSVWKTRACNLVQCTLQTLCYMRDNPSKNEDVAQSSFVLDVKAIYTYLELDNLIKLYKLRKDLPEDIKQNLKNYLQSLPGFQENMPKQNDTTHEQHGYLQMQLIPAVNLLKVLIENSQLLIVPIEKEIDIYLGKYAHDVSWKKFFWPKEAVSDFFSFAVTSLIYHHLNEVKPSPEKILSKSDFFNLFSSYSLIDLFILTNYTLNAELKNGALKVLISFLQHIDIVKIYSKDLASYSNESSKSLYYQAYIKSDEKEKESVPDFAKGKRKVN